jgi:hypothetical protein
VTADPGKLAILQYSGFINMAGRLIVGTSHSHSYKYRIISRGKLKFHDFDYREDYPTLNVSLLVPVISPLRE